MEHKEERVIEGPHHREQGISKEVDHLHPEKQIEDYENQSEEEGEKRADYPSLEEIEFLWSWPSLTDYRWELLKEEEDDDYTREDDHGDTKSSDEFIWDLFI